MTSRRASIWNLDPASYVPSTLHSVDRAWRETNCYVDVWIELLHARGLPPEMAMAFTVATDFEGDQWTFYKPPLGDLDDLFGAIVQEFNPWDRIEEHVLEQARHGRMLIIDADPWWLPDTRGMTYHAGHGKTAIGIESIDLDAGTMNYFHGAGYFRLDGDDFRGVFRLDGAAPEIMAPYCELVRWPVVRTPSTDDVIKLLSKYVARVPTENPVVAMAKRFAEVDRAWLAARPMEDFHRWAFATLRQCGSAHEVAASFLRWLGAAANRPALTDAAPLFDAISTGAKAMQFKLARAINGKKTIDAEAMFGELATAWQTAQTALAAVLTAS